MHSNYRTGIDGSRALDVVPVVLFHAGPGLPGGYVNVGIVFVISGYLIAADQLKGDDRGLAGNCHGYRDGILLAGDVDHLSRQGSISALDGVLPMSCAATEKWPR